MDDRPENPVAQPWLPPPASAPAWTPAAYPPPGGPGHGPAIAALILGIAGLFLVVVGFGFLFVFSLPCSILAWVFGVQGKRRVDRGETAEHRGLAQAGFIMGVVGVALAVAAIVGWIALFVALDELHLEGV